MSELELSNNPNVDTGFVTDGNQKNKVQLVAQLDASDIELPSSPNSDSGYVTINGKKHKVKLTAVLYGGGTSEIVHDATLSGSGTAESPLKVADNTYLPLSGGALTGPLVSSKNVPSFEKTPVLSLCAKKADGTNGPIATISMISNINTLFLNSMLSLDTILSKNVGSGAQKVRLAYIAKINNGADLAVPTEGGTLARVEDINAAVGDIASVLDAINGEPV